MPEVCGYSNATGSLNEVGIALKWEFEWESKGFFGLRSDCFGFISVILRRYTNARAFLRSVNEKGAQELRSKNKTVTAVFFRR